MIKMYPGNKLESLTQNFVKVMRKENIISSFLQKTSTNYALLALGSLSRIYHKVFGWKHNCCSNTSDRRRQENSIKERSEGEVYSV